MDAVLNEPDMRGRLTASFDVIGLDIFDDSELTALDSRQYRVKDYVLKHRASNTPTLIFLGAGGEMLLRIVGYYPPDRFRQVLDYLEAKAYLRQPLGEFMRAASRAQAGDDSPIIADTLFAPPPYMLDRTLPAERPLVVVFESPGCESCERFHRRVLADTAVRRLIGEYEAVQLDATDENGRMITPDGEKSTPSSWYRRLGLDYLPSIVFFDTGGQEVMRIDSETQRFRMQGSLQLVLAGTGAEDAQLQRWRRARAIAGYFYTR
jgi:thioredoxin-related protein